MKIHRSSSPQKMVDAFNARINQLGGYAEVESSSDITASKEVPIYEDDDWEMYEDVGGGFGEPGVRYTLRNIKEYWNESNESDPSLVDYDSFESWWKDTHSNFMKRVEDDEIYSSEIDAGCHGSAESSETEINEELEDVTGEEDLMEELDSEFIDSSEDIACSFDVDSIDVDKLFEVIDVYNGASRPVSGDWDDETAHEQQTIADAFGISLEDAKEVMIKILGFPEDDAFIGASTSITSDYNIYSGFDDVEDVSWEELDSKPVRDSDGFLTDYTLYHNTVTGEYACVFGDKEYYTPGEGYFDWQGDSEDEAYEWFESYEGFSDDDTLLD